MEHAPTNEDAGERRREDGEVEEDREAEEENVELEHEDCEPEEEGSEPVESEEGDDDPETKDIKREVIDLEESNEWTRNGKPSSGQTEHVDPGSRGDISAYHQALASECCDELCFNSKKKENLWSG